MGYTGGSGERPEPIARLGLRVSVGASRSEIVGRHGKAWKVRVAAQAERGRANEALLDLLSETLGVARARINLRAGRAARDKVVEVEGIAFEEAERLLDAGRRKEGA